MTISVRANDSREKFLESPKELEPISNEGGIYHWIGFTDFGNAIKSCKRKEYVPASISASLGLLKMGVTGFAGYGIYKYFSGDKVYANELAVQTQNIFSKKSNESYVPQSARDLIKFYYKEQKKFSNWATSGKDFLRTHLTENAPMSIAIVKHMLEEAEKESDRTLKKSLLDTCIKASVTSKSCIAALYSLIGSAEPQNLSTLAGGLRKAAVETCKAAGLPEKICDEAADVIVELPKSKSLSLVMKILGKCQNKQNGFCKETFQAAQNLALKEQSLKDVLFLTSKIKTDHPKSRPFIKDAIDLFEKNIQVFEKAADDYKESLKGNNSTIAASLGRADLYEWIELKTSSVELKSYLERKQRETTEGLKSLLSRGGPKLTKACSYFQDLEACKQFLGKMFNKLLPDGAYKEVYKLLLANYEFLRQQIGFFLERLASANEWSFGIKVILELQKKYPNLEIKNEITQFLSNLLASNVSHLAIDLIRFSESDPKLFSDIIEKSFLNEDVHHLNKVYLLAKSWINGDKVSHEKDLLKVIQKLFESRRCGSRYTFCQNNKEVKIVMAKVLTTKWLQAIAPDSPELKKLDAPGYEFSSYRLLGSSFDQYSRTIDQSNWKEIIERAGYETPLKKNSFLGISFNFNLF